MRVLSLGAGVQSSTLLLMMCAGEIEKADCAIFADTQWEPKAVYRWLDEVLEPEAAAAGIPIYRVTAGNIRADALRTDHRFASMPVFVKSPGGDGEGMARRQCTREYKIAPIRRKVRELNGSFTTMLYGITLDEAHRMRESDVQYITNEYPLIFDKEMRRGGCLRWLTDRGLSPSRSACIGCPFRSNREWLELKENSPDEWQDAVEFDHAIRERGYSKLTQEAYLHRTLRPLDEVYLQEDQTDLWGNECEGVCGA